MIWARRCVNCFRHNFVVQNSYQNLGLSRNSSNIKILEEKLIKLKNYQDDVRSFHKYYKD